MWQRPWATKACCQGLAGFRDFCLVPRRFWFRPWNVLGGHSPNLPRRTVFLVPFRLGCLLRLYLVWVLELALAILCWNIAGERGHLARPWPWRACSAFRNPWSMMLAVWDCSSFPPCPIRGEFFPYKYSLLCHMVSWQFLCPFERSHLAPLFLFISGFCLVFNWICFFVSFFTVLFYNYSFVLEFVTSKYASSSFVVPSQVFFCC